MSRNVKIVVVSQHYPPDQNTTSAIMATIARHLNAKATVLVVSGTEGAVSAAASYESGPTICEVRNRVTGKVNLVRRAIAESMFSARVFLVLLRKLRRQDIVLTVTAPFMLPYAVAAAVRLKRARSVLIMHDLFPDVLVMAGLLRPKSLMTKIIHGANAIMFRMLSAVVIIGRDTEALLLRHRGLKRERIHFIPNWTTLVPGVRPVEANNRYRRYSDARFVVGLSGNLGFSHDPEIVFEAASQLRSETGIHFLLSGWGIGFERLSQLQKDRQLPNVTLVERVPDDSLDQFLAAADVWLIPYRKDFAGVSVPSRFYNLLAIGRPVVLVSEPNAEAALTVSDNDLGWVVEPGNSAQLAETLLLASRSTGTSRNERCVAAAQQFDVKHAMESYSRLIDKLIP